MRWIGLWAVVVISVVILMVTVAFIPSTYNAKGIRDTLFPKTSLAECGTATWCTYCPGAEGALNRLANEKSLNELAIVEYHDQDSYSSVDSLCSDRLNFYSVPGIPETFFSGENAALGGSTNPDDPEMYNWYKSKINNDLQNETGVVLALDTDLSGNTLSVIVNITCGETPTDTNLYLEVMLVYDENITDGNYHIRYSALKWIGEDPITLSVGDILTKYYSTTLDSSWDKSKLYVVAFVQTHNTHNAGSGGYTWKEAKVYNSVIQPIQKWELKPHESVVNATVGSVYELNTTLRNELSEVRTVKVGYDPSTVPNGWSIEICVGGMCYTTPQVNVTLQPGESENVYYHITPGDSQTAYIKIYTQGNQWYSDVHYIKVSSSAVPEFNGVFVPLLFVVGSVVLLRRRVFH